MLIGGIFLVLYGLEVMIIKLKFGRQKINGNMNMKKLVCFYFWGYEILIKDILLYLCNLKIKMILNIIILKYFFLESFL